MSLANAQSVLRSFVLDFAPPILVRALKRLRAKDQAIAHPLGIELGPAENQIIAEWYVGHRLFDRFLPVLSRHLPAGWIVDVGANVGDTAVAITRACSNPIFAVEASGDLYPVLVRNTASLPVRCVCAVAGTGRYRGQLVGSGPSTRLLRSDTESSNPKSIDQLLENASIPVDQIVLIKTDTEGYDADVMLSAKNALCASEPMLFWENQFFDDIKEKDWHAFYDAIAALGYDHLWAFDNYGNLMLAECTYEALHDLKRYIVSQARYGCTRTIYYVDVLAATDRHVGRARQAVTEYRTAIIEREHEEAP